jgi:hypothetical protein
LTVSVQVLVAIVFALAMLQPAHAANFNCCPLDLVTGQPNCTCVDPATGQPTCPQNPTTGAFIGDVACLITAINAANATPEADTLVLPVSTYTLTAPFNPSAGLNATGLPRITRPLTIQGTTGTTTGGGTGNAFNNGTIITRDVSLGLSSIFRVFEVLSGGDLTLQNVIVRGGLAQFGGGIRNNSGGALELIRSEVSSSQAAAGGGIHNAGILTLQESVVRVNNASTFSTVIPTLPQPKGLAGGIYNTNTGTVELFSNTAIGDTASLANGNTAEISGGGMVNDGGLVILSNSAFGFNGAASVNGFGGGLLNVNNGRVELTNCGFGNNLGFNGGGLSNLGGQVNVCRCGFGNNVGFLGGGIYNNNVTNVARVAFGCPASNPSTPGFNAFNANQARNPATGAVGQGGAIWNGSGSAGVTLRQFTVFMSNTPTNCAPTPGPTGSVPGCPRP